MQIVTPLYMDHKQIVDTVFKILCKKESETFLFAFFQKKY